MSRDSGSVLSSFSLLSSLYLGLRQRRTLVGVGLVIALFGSLVLATFVPEFVLTDDEQRFELWVFNGFQGAVLFATLLAGPLAIVYALWNGGVVLSAAIPAVSVLTGHLVAGHGVVTIDLTLAFAAGGCAGVVATVRTWQFAERAVDNPRSLGLSRVLFAGIALSVAGFSLSALSLWQLVQTAGAHVTIGVWVTSGLLLATLCGYLVVCVLVVVPERIRALALW